MVGYGNGTPQRCADNLLKTPRFSVPYERIKGIDGALIDAPAAKAGLAADAEWVIETYEPRARVNSVKVGDDFSDFGITADLTIKKEEAV